MQHKWTWAAPLISRYRHLCVWRHPSIRMTWLIHMCVTGLIHMCVTWLIHLCVASLPHMCAMPSVCMPIYLCDMTHVCPSTCVTWLTHEQMTHHLCAMSSSCMPIYMCAMTHVCPTTCVTWRINKWHRLEIFWRNVQWTHCNTLLIICVPWLMYAHLHVCHDSNMPIYMCDTTHSLTNATHCTSSVCHDSCMPIYMCDMTHSLPHDTLYVCHALFMYAHLHVWHDSCMLIYMCDMTHSLTHVMSHM